VVRAEQLAGELGCLGLDGIDVVTAGIEAMVRIAFGILIREPGALRKLDRQRAIVFTGDELEIAALVAELLDDRPGDGREDRREMIERGVNGSCHRIERLSATLIKIPR
jgi:hypothetical protein